MSKLKVKELFDAFDAIIARGKDVYAKGCYGQQLTKSIINAKAKQSTSMQSWYEGQSEQAKCSNKDYLLDHIGWQGFDCVCLIKGILWGSRAGVCGKYASNDVPDITANTMITRCTDVTTDLAKVAPGMCIWMSGHVGIVYDAETVYETSPKTGKVVKRTIKGQPWVKAGYLPWVDYSSTTATSSVSETTTMTVSNCYYLNVRKGPGTIYGVVKTIKAGTKVTVYESSGGWCRIGTNQWCSGSYLK